MLENMDRKLSKKRSRISRPARLSWPSGAIRTTTTLGGSSTSSSAPKKSAPVSASASKIKRSASGDSDPEKKDLDSSLWTEKHAPVSQNELCVAPKKVQEAKSWIEGALQSGRTSSKLLILIGSPGIGKSQMVRVLARELNLSLREWNDLHHFSNPKNHSNDGMSFHHQSQLNSFSDFLLSSGAGFTSLTLSKAPQAQGKSRKRQRNSRGKSDSQDDGDGALILLEELPNLYDADAERQFRSIMTEHLERSAIPTIFICSDVCEGKHRPEVLERLVDRHLLYSPSVRIMQVNPVTKAKMKKCLELVAKGEGLGPGILTSEFLEETYSKSGGDLRHAIMAFQFHSLGQNETCHYHARDMKLSTFHALGKLLYAKRKKDPSGPCVGGGVSNERPPLEFDPEEIMNESDFGVEGAVSFLGYHSPDFFTDIDELSGAFSHFSDAAFLLDRKYDGQRGPSDSAFPLSYASSLAGRAVADTNKHPTPNKFRAFSAPKVFDVLRKNKSNALFLQQLSRRLSAGEIGSAQSFVTEQLPYLKTILPYEVNYAMQNLHSFVRDATSGEKEKMVTAHSTDVETQRALEDQEMILNEDDIIDDGSSLSDNDDEKKQAGARKDKFQSHAVVSQKSQTPSPNGNRNNDNPKRETAEYDFTATKVLGHDKARNAALPEAILIEEVQPDSNSNLNEQVSMIATKKSKESADIALESEHSLLDGHPEEVIVIDV